MAGNPLIELSTAAGLGSEALNFIRDDPERSAAFTAWLAAQTPGPSRWPEGGDWGKVLYCCALACAGLSRILSQGESPQAADGTVHIVPGDRELLYALLPSVADPSEGDVVRAAKDGFEVVRTGGNWVEQPPRTVR